MKLIDSHCHVTDVEYGENLHEILKDVEDKLEYIINIGCDLDSSKKCLDISKNLPFMFSSVGIHPNHIDTYSSDQESEIKNLIKDKKVVAIGECGLDYYRVADNKNSQIKLFEKHLEWASEFNKPLVIHGRDAYKDIIDILSSRDYKNIKGVMHSFTGLYEDVFPILDRFYCSINGIVTFKNNTIQDMVKKMPLENLILETDAPYLSPVPFRGKINKPSYIYYTAEKVAEIKLIPVEDLIRITNLNTKKLFSI